MLFLLTTYRVAQFVFLTQLYCTRRATRRIIPKIQSVEIFRYARERSWEISVTRFERSFVWEGNSMRVTNFVDISLVNQCIRR